MGVTWVNGPLFVELLTETVAVMRRARDHIAWIEAHAEGLADDDLRLRQAAACSRITARLAAVMSWLLAQRAVATEELSVDQARERRLFGVGDPRVEDDGPTDRLSATLVALLSASGSLYRRVAHLEELTCRR